MSASASKKKRKELEQLGTNTKAVAAQKEQDKKKQTTRNVLIFAAVVIVAIIGIALLLNAMNAPSYDVSKPVATVGDQKITVPVYDYFYNMSASNLSQFVSYGIVQTGVPLSQQKSGFFGEGTVEDYLIDTTNSTVKECLNVYSRAIADGYKLTDSDKENIDAALKQVKTEAASYGFPNVKKYMAARFGEGCDLSNYEDYLNIYMTFASYYNHLQETFAPSDEELKAAYEKDPTAYDLVRFTYASISAEGEKDEDSGETTYTDEAKEEARKKAEEKLDHMDEETTTVNYNKSSTDSMNKELSDWLFDDARQAGDTVVIARNEENTSFYAVRFDARENNDYKLVNAYVISIAKDTGEVEEGKETAEVKLDKLTSGLEDTMTDEEFETYVSGLGYSASVSRLPKNNYGQAVDDFLFDPARKAGEISVITTDSTYYVVRFVSVDEESYQAVLVKNTLWSDYYQEIASANEITVDEEMLKYAYTDLTFQGSSDATTDDEASVETAEQADK